MSKSIERYRLEERVLVASCKHRGNAAMVAKEVGISYEMAVEQCRKLRNRIKTDADMMVCSNIMELIIMGRESRIQYYTIMLNALEGRDSIELSVCHKALMVVKHEHEAPVCLQCGQNSGSYLEHQSGIYQIRMDLLEQLRKEDIAIVEFADRMGYTQKQATTAVVYKDERKTINIIGGKPVTFDGIPEKQKILLEEAGKLSPIERTEIINNIQRGLLQIEDPSSDNDK